LDIKDKVTVWAGVLTLAVLQLEERIDTELNLYYSDWVGVAGTVVGYVVGFVIVYAVFRLVLERYFKARSQPLSSSNGVLVRQDAKVADNLGN
jgi:membrane protein YdbS with pleckstrin-like domain